MTWKFDSVVAETFVEHARQHIPDYDRVIDKCIELCCNKLQEQSQIVDVGCATGETIRRLHQAGFKNLTGVEASHAMLKYCNYKIATYKHTDRFPNQSFDAVLCNWTLHFVEDKIKYLTDIYANLQPGGFLVLSEKTSLDPTAIHFYHRWKRQQGVSWDDIRNKEQAVKNVMYINDPQWYMDTLDFLGFRDIQIINADWCFTTFLCYK